MSNLIPTNIKVPAHIAARMQQPSALAAAVMSGLSSGESFPRISIKGARFRIREGDTESVLDATSIDVVIVGANPALSKTYYASAWDPNSDPEAPDCQSIGGEVPDHDVVDRQAENCALCRHNQWGSKISPNGAETKACSDQKRLAVVSADDPSGPIYLLSVTPAALKGLNKYQKELAMRGIPPEVVKTRISFDTDASFPKLVFGFAGFISEAEQAVVDTLFGSPQVEEITGESRAKQEAVFAEQGVTKPAAKGGKAAKPAAKPAPTAKAVADTVAQVLADVEEDEEEEVAPAPAPAPAAKKGLGGAKKGLGAAKPAPSMFDAADEDEGAEEEAAPAPAKKGFGAAPKKGLSAVKAPVAEEAAGIANDISKLLGDMGDDD